MALAWAAVSCALSTKSVALLSNTKRVTSLEKAHIARRPVSRVGSSLHSSARISSGTSSSGGSEARGTPASRKAVFCRLAATPLDVVMVAVVRAAAGRRRSTSCVQLCTEHEPSKTRSAARRVCA
jgi:hypothetical protein